MESRFIVLHGWQNIFCFCVQSLVNLIFLSLFFNANCFIMLHCFIEEFIAVSNSVKKPNCICGCITFHYVDLYCLGYCCSIFLFTIFAIFLCFIVYDFQNLSWLTLIYCLCYLSSTVLLSSFDFYFLGYCCMISFLIPSY